MRNVYYDPGHPAERFRKGLQSETSDKVSDEQVKDFLVRQSAYTLHKPAKVHFPRNKVFVS